MFSDDEYKKVNREERFYCLLFVHSILGSSQYRKNIVNLIQDKLKISLNHDDIQAFVEVAALRDYWYNLGDPIKYTNETGENRKRVLKKIIETYEKDSVVCDVLEKDVFLTNGKDSKFCYPGRWVKERLKSFGYKKLLKVKLAFNAKPDILLLSSNSAVVIEAKIGEKESKNEGFTQSEIQEEAIKLWKLLIPAFEVIDDIKHTTLTLKKRDGLNWREVVGEIDKYEDIDGFTKDCFSSLLDQNV